MQEYLQEINTVMREEQEKDREEIYQEQKRDQLLIAYV